LRSARGAAAFLAAVGLAAFLLAFAPALAAFFGAVALALAPFAVFLALRRAVLLAGGFQRSRMVARSTLVPRSMPDVAPGKLTAALAERVIGWKASPDRFMKSGRSWIPRWRFQALVELADAFRLLDKGARQYTLTCDRRRAFIVEVQIGIRRGKASNKNKARAITLAVARALGLEVGE